MLVKQFIKFIINLKKKDNKKLNYISELGKTGAEIVSEYSTRFDLLEVDKCLYLSSMQIQNLSKEEKHLLNLISIKNPLFSLLEFYDNYPYSCSDTNCIFKGSLKSGVEVSIKVVNLNAEKAYIKKIHRLNNVLNRYFFIFPRLQKRFRIEEIIRNIENINTEKFDLVNEIKCTQILKDYLLVYKDCKILEKARFSNIYSYLSSENMIVREYIYGTYFKELLEYKKLTYNDVLEVIKIQLFYIFNIGIFYNNLNSDNLILGDDKNIYFIDCNLITYISNNTRLGFFKLLKSICNLDYEKMKEALNALSSTKTTDENISRLIAKLNIVFAKNNQNFMWFLLQVLKISTLYDLTYDDEIFSVIKPLLYLNTLVSKVKSKRGDFINDLRQIITEIEEFTILKNVEEEL